MALEKSAKTHEQNRLSTWLAAVVVGILIVVIMVACAGLLRRLHKNNERIEELSSGPRILRNIGNIPRPGNTSRRSPERNWVWSTMEK